MDFIKTYLERDIPNLGPRVPAETLSRLWTMLAHAQGTNLNAAKLASALDVSSPTIARYIDLLVDLLLVHKLRPAPTSPPTHKVAIHGQADSFPMKDGIRAMGLYEFMRMLEGSAV